MIARHLETRSPYEPPVRFYKTIALSFLAVTLILLGVVVFITAKSATINITAKEDAKQVSLTVPVGDGADKLKGAITTSSFEWSNTYYPTGVKTAEDKATGKVMLYNKQTQPQTLIKNTRLLTAEGVLFRMKDKATIPANGQIEVDVYADEVGAKGEIEASQFTVPGLSPELQKVVYAESKNKMTGGVKKIGILSEEDLTAAKASYKDQVKSEYIKTNNVDTKNAAISVETENFTADKKVGDEVSEFKLTGKNKIVVVKFDQNDLSQYVANNASKEIDKDSEKFLSVNNDSTVVLNSVNEAAGTAELGVTQEVLVTLDVNGNKLALSNFTGKKKDEIQRYVLSLDHVKDVDVVFSPSWMRSVPSVVDKIQVVVKNTK